jgi:hypothetical protein
MKPSGIICAGLVLLSTMLMAQTIVKTDSINQVTDTLNLQSINKNLGLQKQAEIKQPKLLSPGENRNLSDYPFAMAPMQKSRHFSDPVFRMPLVKPQYQSNMPVMNPDSTIHFHLQIKKIAPVYKR